MNASQFLLPPELIATLSDACTHPPRVHPADPDASESGRFDELATLPCGGNAAPDVQIPDDAAAWLTSCSLSHQPFGDFRRTSFGLLDDLPDLSHTPLSCHSDVSKDSLPPNLLELDLTSYLSELDVLGTAQVAEKWIDHYRSFMFPLSPCSGIDAANESSLTIHSPKPIFAYKTLQFDLDRSHSPQMTEQQLASTPNGSLGGKRPRDDEEEVGEACQPKKRRLVQDHPRLVPLLSGTHSDLVTACRRCSTSDATYTEADVFAMDKLLDSMHGWDDGAWPNSLGC